MNGDNEALVGPSGMEILKQEIDGLEKFRKSRREERYRYTLQGLAYKWFEINENEFNGLKSEQVTALEILADRRIKKNMKIWLWTNLGFVAGVGALSLLISPGFLLGLLFLVFNSAVSIGLKDEVKFRIEARELNKKFDPKLLVQNKKMKLL